MATNNNNNSIGFIFFYIYSRINLTNFSFRFLYKRIRILILNTTLKKINIINIYFPATSIKELIRDNIIKELLEILTRFLEKEKN